MRFYQIRKQTANNNQCCRVGVDVDKEASACSMGLACFVKSKSWVLDSAFVGLSVDTTCRNMLKILVMGVGGYM
jgi:hypothetical protein